jgi:hypothetical protein
MIKLAIPLLHVSNRLPQRILVPSDAPRLATLGASRVRWTRA